MDSSVVTDGINKRFSVMCIPRSQSDVNKYKYMYRVVMCIINRINCIHVIRTFITFAIFGHSLTHSLNIHT